MTTRRYPKHLPNTWDDTTTHCKKCGEPWPCKAGLSWNDGTNDESHLIIVRVSDSWDEERNVGGAYGPFDTWEDAEEWVKGLRDDVRWTISRVMPPDAAHLYRK